MSKEKKQGKLIVFEGPDDVGKSTLSKSLASRLKAMGLPCDHMSFPGKEQGSIGHLVYGVHHEPASYGLKAIADISLQALHIAAHLDEIERRIIPALNEGRWVILDRFWWSAWVYGRAASVEDSTLDALIQAERLHWRDIKPDTLFLIDRTNDEVDRDARAPLREGYLVLSDRERQYYPVHRIQNDGTVEDSLRQTLALIQSILPNDCRADSADLARTVKGPPDQLPLLPSTSSKALFTFTASSPARPTVAYETYWRFAAERQEVFFRKIEGLPAPWTNDPILTRHKFTNVYRASDRVSQYLIKHVIYEGDQSPEEVFFRTILFKLFNKIETWKLIQARLNSISWENYSFTKLDSVLSRALAEGSRIYSAAYMMPSGRSSFGYRQKHRNHLTLLERMMDDEVPHRIGEASSMAQAFTLLQSYPTIGNFLAYQFATDLNYSDLTDFSEMEFVVPGPGALDGIHKCFEDLGGLNAADIIRLIADSQEREFERRGLIFRTLWGRKLQLIDCQNLFCEVSKYARVKHPDIKGISKRTRIKQLYRPSTKPIEYWYPPKWGINNLLPRLGLPA